MAGNDGDESAPAPTISYDDFRKVDIRVGTIVGRRAVSGGAAAGAQADDRLRPAIGQRRSSAQIVTHYKSDELVGRQVAAVVNFPKKQIGKFMSEVLVLGFPDGAGEVVMIAPDKPVPNGGRLY